MEISSTVRRLTQDLNALVKSLSPGEEADSAAVIEAILAPEVLQNFKQAVDSMRRLLWTYILAASQAASGDINHSIHGPRLQRATEALRDLRQERMPLFELPPEEGSLMEQVEALLTRYDSR